MRWLAWAVATAILLAGLSWLAVRHYVWPNLDRWRPEIEQRISAAIGRPVKLGQLVTGFDGLRPRLVARDVAIEDDEGGGAFSAAEIRAVLSLRSLLSGQPRLALLEIDAPQLRVERLANRRLRIAGVDLDPRFGGHALELLFAHRRVVLRHARVEWHDRTNGESAMLRDVDIALGSVGRRHRASLRAPALFDVAAGVDAAIEFYRPPFSQLGEWRKWNGEAYVGAQRIDLAALARRWQSWAGDGADVAPAVTPGESSAQAPAGFGVGAGQARLRAWSHFEQGAAVDALVRLALDDVEIESHGRRLPLRAASMEAHARRQPDASTAIELSQLRIDDDQGNPLPVADEASRLVLAPDGRLLAARLSLGRFDSATMLALAGRLPLPEPVRGHLDGWRVAGTVSRFAIDWAAAREGATAAAPRGRFGIDLALERFSAEHAGPPPQPGTPGLPGFANLSGTARITESGGQVLLRGEAAMLRFPGVFADPELALDRFEADAGWTVGPPAAAGSAAIDVDVRAVRFANADASGEFSGRYRSGGKGIGIVDMKGSLRRADAASIARYLPLQVPEKVRQWVGASVRAGRSDDVRFVLEGDLEDFPFREPGSGEFRVEAKVSDATLAYAPGWPAIERIQARLRFERAGMEIDAQAARVWDVALSATKARIAEFRDPLLRVEGIAQGPAQDMVRFVNESPLLERIDGFTRETTVSGGARLQLALEIPLDDVDAAQVRGSVQLSGNHVALDPALPPVDRVAGRLEFTETGIALRSLAGFLLGGPVSVDGGTTGPGSLQLIAQGTVPAEGIVQLADNVLTRRLAGATAYRAEIDVRDGVPTVVIRSGLEGLSSTLPPPFEKTAEATWPLRVESRPARPDAPGRQPGRDTLAVTLRDDVRLVLERERDPASQRLTVRRGAFAVADEPTLPDAGFAVLVRADGIDLDAWNSLLGDDLMEKAKTGIGDGFSLLPDTVSLVAGQVGVAGKTLHDVVLGASRIDELWRANMHSREIDGYFSWRRAAPGQQQGTLVARFARLEIPRDRIDEFETLLDTTPESLPALDIAAEELILNDRRLGAMELEAMNGGTPAAPVWQLRTLRLRNPAATLTASGSWQTRPGVVRRATAMDFELQMADAGALLALFGYPDTVSGGAGVLGGQVRWVGSPFRLDYRTLAGELAIDLGKGQFLKSEPGAAKLIGVLNLQSLRRRLAFDFRDVFAEGFAFDRITGHARIDNGIARTDDFEMRGVAAQVGIRGEADIGAETQTLVVEVRPELNAGLASLAYAALANPAIGLGSFVAQLALRQPLQQIFAYEYDVTGPWGDPHVVERARPPVPLPAPMQ